MSPENASHLVNTEALRPIQFGKNMQCSLWRRWLRSQLGMTPCQLTLNDRIIHGVNINVLCVNTTVDYPRVPAHCEDNISSRTI